MINCYAIQSLDWEDPLEEGMETHFSILAWRIPMDRGAWWATVPGWKESNTTEQLSTAHRHSNHMLSGHFQNSFKIKFDLLNSFGRHASIYVFSFNSPLNSMMLTFYDLWNKHWKRYITYPSCQDSQVVLTQFEPCPYDSRIHCSFHKAPAQNTNISRSYDEHYIVPSTSTSPSSYFFLKVWLSILRK